MSFSNSVVFDRLGVPEQCSVSGSSEFLRKNSFPTLFLTMLSLVQVTTNGIIAMSEPPAKESYPGVFPPTFGVVAPFLADLDTTDGLGKVYYREDLSPSVTQLAAECVQRGFPEVSFQPSSVVVVTWESVAPYQGPSKDPEQEGKVSTLPSTRLSIGWFYILWSSLKEERFLSRSRKPSLYLKSLFGTCLCFSLETIISFHHYLIFIVLQSREKLERSKSTPFKQRMF